MPKAGFVALAGRPNAGKSTFLNRVLGEKVVIVSDKPQTTRNRIMGVYHGDDLQIGFLDLPGIHKPGHVMNKRMMRDVHLGLEDADLILHLVDITAPIGKGDLYVKELLEKKELPVVVVANKIDLVNKAKMIATLQHIQDRLEPDHLVPISAKDGENTDRLLKLLADHLPEGPLLFDEDTLTDQPVRFMVAEFIREKVLHYTREEIPHASAVKIDHFELDQENGSYFIAAKIFVERPNQRQILLGKGGSMISKIRTGAKRGLKQLLGQPVELDLLVKAEADWRDKKAFLDTELELKE